MAREFYGYFDSTLDDVREYDGGQFAQLLRAVARNGVTSHEGGLAVTADGLGMQTEVLPGGCLVNGYLYVLEDDGGARMLMEHQPSGAADRYDRIVARLDLNTEERDMGLYLLSGTPAADPQPPELTRTALVYEVSLARVRVRAGATVIEPEDVEDERADESVCGYAMPVRVSAMLAEKMDAQSGVELAAEVAGKASTAGYAATLLGAGWSAGVPHTQTVAVEGMLATDNPFVDVDMSGATTGAAGTALSDAWTLVGRVEAGAGSITAHCYDDAPAVDIPLILKVVR